MSAKKRISIHLKSGAAIPMHVSGFTAVTQLGDLKEIRWEESDVDLLWIRVEAIDAITHLREETKS